MHPQQSMRTITCTARQTGRKLAPESCSQRAGLPLGSDALGPIREQGFTATRGGENA